MPAPRAGLALSTSLSGFVNAARLYRGLRHDGTLPDVGNLPSFLLRVAVACGVMAMLLLNLVPSLERWLAAGVFTRCLWLAACIGGAVAAYFTALYAVGLRPAHFRMKTARSPV